MIVHLGPKWILSSNSKTAKYIYVTENKKKQEICRKRIKAGFFNVIIQDIAVHGTND